jgi:mannose-6-phosphate isomerase
MTINTVLKPWGKEELIEVNERYVVKKLTMLKGHRCSIQYHIKKHETIYVLSGALRIFQGSSPDKLESNLFLPNDFISLNPGVIHRMEAEEDSVYLEASTPELDDVVRLVDDYQRI